MTTRFSTCGPAASGWSATLVGYDAHWHSTDQVPQRLIEAGNRVALVNYEGMIHGYFLMGGAVDAARRAVAQSAAALQEAFNAAQPGGPSPSR